MTTPGRPRTMVALLAAGQGQRLQPLTAACPKALLDLGGQALLDHQLASLREAGVGPRDVVVVTGHMGHLLDQRAATLGFQTVFNERWAEANNIVSLHRLVRWIRTQQIHTESLLVLNCDVVVHPQIVKDLVSGGAEDAIAIDAGTTAGDAEAMKVEIVNGFVRRFGKQLGVGEVHGEYIGLARLGPVGFRAVAAELDAMIRDGRDDQWYEAALTRAATRVPFHPVFTQGRPWAEIDTHDDYEYARTLFAAHFR